MVSVNKDKQYIKIRKQLLKEMQEAVYERTKINKKIRRIKRDMERWDSYLINYS